MIKLNFKGLPEVINLITAERYKLIKADQIINVKVHLKGHKSQLLSNLYYAIELHSKIEIASFEMCKC